MNKTLEQFARELRDGSPWSRPTGWYDLPYERKQKWLEFARHVVGVCAGLHADVKIEVVGEASDHGQSVGVTILPSWGGSS